MILQADGAGTIVRNDVVFCARRLSSPRRDRSIVSSGQLRGGSGRTVGGISLAGGHRNSTEATISVTERNCASSQPAALSAWTPGRLIGGHQSRSADQVALRIEVDRI
jgi:hypothetical protein